MKVRMPPSIRPGDRIGVVAPAGPVDPTALAQGLEWLEHAGFQVVQGRHLLERRAYLAGADAGRAADLTRMLGDPAIQAVWCARGGYGSHRIVSRIDWRALHRRPKAIVGYSDATVLQSAAWMKAGVSSFYGPTVAELGSSRAFDAGVLMRALAGDDLRFDLPSSTVLRQGTGEGRLVGGCLAILVSLLGTPYELDTDGAILFWEDVNEEPFRIDRMLAQLRLAGKLKRLRGMVVGRLTGCRALRRGYNVPIEKILGDHLAGTNYPVVTRFPAGHVALKATLPLGRRARLDTRGLRLTFAAAS